MSAAEFRHADGVWWARLEDGAVYRREDGFSWVDRDGRAAPFEAALERDLAAFQRDKAWGANPFVEPEVPEHERVEARWDLNDELIYVKNDEELLAYVQEGEYVVFGFSSNPLERGTGDRSATEKALRRYLPGLVVLS